MAVQTVQRVLDIGRLALGRRNTNDPDSNDDIFLNYLNEFVTTTMSDDVKLFEQFGTCIFTIDETNTTGVYNIQDVFDQTGVDFINFSMECFISLLDPINNSVSWNYLPIYQNPGEFFSIWGINNEEILIPGYPTNLLYYGDELTFRTIPNTSYQVRIFAYKKNSLYEGSDSNIQYDYWLRYLAYGWAMNYARDFRYAADVKEELKKDFAHERKLMLTHTHNQIKLSRAMPRF